MTPTRTFRRFVALLAALAAILTALPARAAELPDTDPPSKTGKVDLSQEYLDVIADINGERAAIGLAKLKVDANLQKAAETRAEEITEKMSHTRPNGTKWYTVSKYAHGENLARGIKDTQALVDAFMDSRGHRRNILNKGFTKIGVAMTTYGGDTYWVIEFGRELPPA